MRDSFLDLIRFYSTTIQNGRTPSSILEYLRGETEECQREIDGTGDGKDGVFSEAIDIALCAIDLIFQAKPDATNEEIVAYARKKSEKWKANVNKAKEVE